jgi:predicted lipoprotein with Yx(FWY)xxD motif
MKRIAVLLVAAGLAGCVTSPTNGVAMVGMSAADLYKMKGSPERTSTAPSGATVYTYQAKNIKGNSLCDSSFFVRDGKVVGFSERGPAVNCGGSSGQVN